MWGILRITCVLNQNLSFPRETHTSKDFLVSVLLLLWFLTHIIPFPASISPFLYCKHGNRNKIAYVSAMMREKVVGRRFPAYHLWEESFDNHDNHGLKFTKVTKSLTERWGLPEAFHTGLTTRILTVLQREIPDKSVERCQYLTSPLIRLQYDSLYYHKSCPQLHIIKHAGKACLNLARHVELNSFIHLYLSIWHSSAVRIS